MTATQDYLTIEQEEALEMATTDWVEMGLFSMSTVSALIESGIEPEWLDEHLDEMKLC